MCMYLSFRAAALWFCILTLQILLCKNLQFTVQIFLHTLGVYLSTFQHCSSKYILFPTFGHILSPICISKLTFNSFIYRQICSLVLNFSSSDSNVNQIAENLKQASLLVCREVKKYNTQSAQKNLRCKLQLLKLQYL
jgi:hypothetical protein